MVKRIAIPVCTQLQTSLSNINIIGDIKMLTQKEKQQIRAHKHQTTLMSTKNGCIKRRYFEVRYRSKKQELPFDLTLEYLISIAPEVCPVFKTTLIWKNLTGKIQPNSASLDRIIPDLGYVDGNVQWLSNLANSMKNKASNAELHKFADWINQSIPN